MAVNTALGTIMRRLRFLNVTIIFILLLIGVAGCTSQESELVTFPDKNLDAAIRDALGKSLDEEILSTELAQLENLSIRDKNVHDLTGLEYCVNLTHLDLCGNQISDISPISSLTKLYTLAITESPISDISPLSTLNNLTSLDLAGNQISNISPLRSLSNLTILCLQGNEISDITVLSDLSNLVDLRLTQNHVEDISALVENAGLGEQESVLLGGNNLELYEGSKDMENIKTLEARGVIVSLDPQQWAPEKTPPGAPVPIPQPIPQ